MLLTVRASQADRRRKSSGLALSWPDRRSRISSSSSDGAPLGRDVSDALDDVFGCLGGTNPRLTRSRPLPLPAVTSPAGSNSGYAMEGHHPTVSIGLPVYNGGRFLEETIESILGQTFADLELVISDNASTDATAEICRRFAARDPRVRYSRNQENLGAARNYNITFELARGRYFKWQGHDDPIPPTYLERCVAVLDSDPTVVLAYGRQCPIDEHGHPKRTGALVAARLQGRSGLASRHALVRYLACVTVPVGHPVGPIFGVDPQGGVAPDAASGRLRLARPAADGGTRVAWQVPSAFGHRAVSPLSCGPGASHASDPRPARELVRPARAKLTTYPRVRLLREHFRAVRRATKHPGVRVWLLRGDDLVWFLTEVLGIRPAKSLFRGLYQRFKPAQAAAEG